MSFTSFHFWLVFPFIFCLYWLIPIRFQQTRKLFLIAVSYLLYMNWNPSYALILLGVTAVTGLGGGLLYKHQSKKALVWLYAVLALFPLLVFKYYNFINNSVTDALHAVGLHFSFPGLNWAIPVGISFFTFQAVGYMLDVFHGRIKPERSVIDYILFVCFFPQVMSGPISKASDLLPQIKSSKTFDYDQGKQGLKWLLWGMFIKLVIADRMGMFVDTVYSNYEHYSGATCFAASIFYTIQIYCDFAGYSLMAIGIAATLGVNLINNFRRPYFAVSITDFWRRWHISLTRWLTQHIYIAMGGNRCSKIRNYWNIFVTFLVSGIWHGANWTFIAWGCLHGIVQIIEKAMGWQKYEGKSILMRGFRIFVTFMIVNLAWILFRMPTFSDAYGMIFKIVTQPGILDLSDYGMNALAMTAVGMAVLIFKDCKDEFFPTRLNFVYRPIIRWTTYIVIFCMILAFGVLDGGQFIYVSF